MGLLREKIPVLILIGYLSLLTYWMLFGFGRTVNPGYAYNLMPFATLSKYLHTDHFSLKIWLINTVGNVGVFVPFGILMPLVFRRRTPVLMIAYFEVGLVALETAQLITKRGSFDVDDIMLNTIGALIGYVAYKIIKSGGASST